MAESRKIQEWIDFAFLVDITTHLNKLNSYLQRKEQLMHFMFDHVNAFAMKLTLWETKIMNKYFVRFRTLRSLNVQTTQKHATLTAELKEDFDQRINDIKSLLCVLIRSPTDFL